MNKFKIYFKSTRPSISFKTHLSRFKFQCLSEEFYYFDSIGYYNNIVEKEELNKNHSSPIYSYLCNYLQLMLFNKRNYELVAYKINVFFFKSTKFR